MTIKEKAIRILFVCSIVVTACGPVGVEQQRTTVNRDDSNEGQNSLLSGWNMKSATGALINLGKVLRGEVIIISFFATYCTRCKQKLIDHQNLYEKYAEAGLSVLGVSVDEPETQSEVGTYVRSRGLTFPVVIDTESKLVDQLNPQRTLPFSVLIDCNGNVLWNHVGYVPGDDKLFESHVLDVLKKKTPAVNRDGD